MDPPPPPPAAGSSCLFSCGWSIPETEGQLLPIRPQSHDLPAPSRPPCDLCPAAPVTPFSSPRPPSCKISWESHTPVCACHLNLALESSV